MATKKVSDLVEDYNLKQPMSKLEKILLSGIGIALAFIALKLLGVI
jgi:hypothetical protein